MHCCRNCDNSNIDNCHQKKEDTNIMREMKNSGVAWIGDVPENWEIVKIGQLFQCRNVKVNDTDFQPLSVSKGGIVPQMENVAKSDANDNRKQVLTGDFVINSRSDRKQSCGVSKLDGSVSLINTVLYNFDKSKVIPEYNNYLLKNYGFAEEFYRWGHGIVADLWTTRWQEMKNIEIPLPSIKIQEAILSALRIKSKNISLLISNQEQQIEKLKQYKQSLITEVVTKGLNPDVPMKDSGVEWIGKIPKEWKLSKVSMFYDVTLGKMLQPEKQEETDTLENYLCAANLGNNTLKLNVLKQMWFSQKDKAQYNVKKGDLIVVEGGDVASCDIVRSDVSNLYFQNALHRVRAKKGFSLDFLRYNLIMAKSQGYISLICNKATIAHFTKDKLMTLPMLYIPLPEQQQIATYLDNKCAKIDRLIAIKQEKINKLNDYKKSLIYEYVTGKREVC